MSGLLSEIRHAVRSLSKSPGFLLMAVTTLALGIGANTAIFGLLETVVLRELPVQQPEDLVFVNYAGSESSGASLPYPCFEQLRDHTTQLSDIAAFSTSSLKVFIDGQIEEVSSKLASGSYFSLLGVGTVAGRPFAPTDDLLPGQGGADGPVAVLGYNYWQRRFGLDPAVIGKTIEIGLQCSDCGDDFQRTIVTVIGVAEPGFTGLAPGHDVDLYLPIALKGAQLLADQSGFWLSIVARLDSQSTAEQAQAELTPTFKSYVDSLGFSQDIRAKFLDRVELAPAGKGLGTLRGPFAKPLLALMALVMLVLLIACANVAALFLARVTQHEKDLVVRRALGAERIHIFGKILTEGVLVALLGGFFGLLLARWGSALLVRQISAEQASVLVATELNGKLLLFTFGAALLSVVFFSLAPTLRSLNADPGMMLKEAGSKLAGGSSRLRLRKMLIVGQVALSFLVLTSAGLFLRSLHTLRHEAAGFDAEGVLTMRLDAQALGLADRGLHAFWQDALARAESVAGVRWASLSATTPLDGRAHGTMIEIPGFTAESEVDASVELNHVSADYFETLGITIKRGRGFEKSDRLSTAKVAVMNESAAKFFFGEQDPIGAKIRILHPPMEEPYELVGVVANSRDQNLREESGNLLYLPVAQAITSLESLSLAVRSQVEASALSEPIEATLREAGAGLLVKEVITLEDQRDRSLMRERLVLGLSAALSGLALLLTCIGIYGVMAYDVALRHREIGLRMALGCHRRQVLHLLIKRGMTLVGVGLVLGALASLAAARLLGSLLYGIAPTDPGTFVAAAWILGLIGLAGSFFPAYRGTARDSMAALKEY